MFVSLVLDPHLRLHITSQKSTTCAKKEKFPTGIGRGSSQPKVFMLNNSLLFVGGLCDEMQLQDSQKWTRSAEREGLNQVARALLYPPPPKRSLLNDTGGDTGDLCFSGKSAL